MHLSTTDIIIAVAAITLILVLSAFFIISYVRLYNQRKKKQAEEKIYMKGEFEKQLLRSQVEVQEATLSALGRELHDNIGQLLSTTKMLLGITERNTGALPDTFATAQATLGKAIHELRSLSKSLDKEWLEQFNFLENIKSEIMRINASQELMIHFSHPEKLELTADKQIILFRIVQEAVQNSIKHARAKNIYINVQAGECIDVTVNDDGEGMPMDNQQGGMGLFNMKQRAKLLGGSIEWLSEPGRGTAAIIKLPAN